MIRKARIAMRSCSAMDAIWQYIRVCISSAHASISNHTPDCYGVPYIPEGQWLCRKCTVSPENPVVSTPPFVFPILLTSISHSLAYYAQTKEALSNRPFLANGSTYYARYGCQRHELQMRFSWNLSPASRRSQSSAGNWSVKANLHIRHEILTRLQKCSLCGIREGACVQCAKTSCFLAFHATCARKEKFLMPMKSTQGAEAVALTCYCEKHLPVRFLNPSAGLF